VRSSSDFRGAIVIPDVLRQAIALCVRNRPLILRLHFTIFLGNQRGGGRGTTGTCGQQEISTGKPRLDTFHRTLLFSPFDINFFSVKNNTLDRHAEQYKRIHLQSQWLMYLRLPHPSYIRCAQASISKADFSRAKKAHANNATLL
jgi:hypothetical protein